MFGVTGLDPLNGNVVDGAAVTQTGSINGNLKTGIVLDGQTGGANFASFGTTAALTNPGAKAATQKIGPVADPNAPLNAVTKLEGILTFEWDPAAQKAGDTITFSKIGVEAAANKAAFKPIPEPACVQLPVLLAAGVLLRRRRNKAI